MKTVVLSGGGAKGAYQWGVLEELIINKNYKIDSIYGTSVGALNALGLSVLGIEGISNIWSNIKKTNDVFSLSWMTLGPIFGNSMYTHKPLRKLLNKYMLNKEIKINITVTKVNIETGELVYHRKNKGEFVDSLFIDSVIASTSVPLVSDPINEVWFDGGIREITPLKKSINDGASEIITILCNPLKLNPDFKKKSTGLLKGIKKGLRAIDILTHECMVNDLRQCIKKNSDDKYRKINLEIYAPSVLVTDTDEFNQPKIQAAREQGKKLEIVDLLN